VSFSAYRLGGTARMFIVLTGLPALAGCGTSQTYALEKGVVLAAVPADQPGANSGSAAIAGMVVGGVAGGQIGEGVGKGLAVVGGIIAGQIAGAAVESTLQHHDGMAYTIRLDDGRVLTVLQHIPDDDPIIPLGARVLLETYGSEQHVEPANS